MQGIGKREEGKREGKRETAGGGLKRIAVIYGSKNEH